MFLAHEWIEAHWAELRTGDVIDVEYLLEETKVKKVSERFGCRPSASLSGDHYNSDQG